jgi:uncharacterized membrane protein YesL
VYRRRNDGLFDFLDKVATFVLANLFWVLLSIPLVTLPIATAGLFATMSLWVRGKSPEVFRDFFRGARQFWLKASLTGLIDTLIAGVIVLNLSIFRLMNSSQFLSVLSQSATLFVALTTITVNLYLWPLMVTFNELSLSRLIITSTKLVFAYPIWSLFMFILAALPFAINLLLPAGMLVLASFSSAALLVNWGAWRIIQRYVPEEEDAEKVASS